jgi:DNA polymerase III psi subunit
MQRQSWINQFVCSAHPSHFAARIRIDLCSDTRLLLNQDQLPAADDPLSLAIPVDNPV